MGLSRNIVNMSIKTLKSLGDIGNLHDIRTTGSVRKSGKPPLPTTAILELYMRRNERDRLMKEVIRLQRRKAQIDRRLGEIGKEMARLYKEATKMATDIRGEEGTSELEAGSRRRKKRIVLNY